MAVLNDCHGPVSRASLSIAGCCLVLVYAVFSLSKSEVDSTEELIGEVCCVKCGRTCAA